MSGSERSRSRSQSPTLTNQSTNSRASRRRSRSPGEKSYSDESFYSETSRKNAKGNKNKKLPPKGPQKKGGKVNSKEVSRRSSTNGGVGVRNNPSTVSRVMSANRLRIQELRNRIMELTDQCLVLQQDNRDYKRQIVKQERRLNGYEQQENGMPQIMQRQAGESQMLRDQLRQQKERSDKKTKKLKEKEDELEAMRRLVKKMQGLVEDKKLMERKKLSEKLKETEDKLREEQEKNQTLERHVQNLSKNHKHQLTSERTKEQELERQIEKLQERYNKLEIDMKEKDKERTLQNIYSLRSMRPPHRLDSSLQSSSQTDLVRTVKTRPERGRVDRRRVGGSGDLTARTDDYGPKKSERRYEDSSAEVSHGDEYGYQRESQASVYRAEDKVSKERDTPRDKERDIARDRDEDPLLRLREERTREQELERRSREKDDAKKKEEARRRREEEEEEEKERRKEEERRREEARRREHERQEEEEEKRKEQEQKRRMENHQQPTRNHQQDQNHFDDRNNNKNDPEMLKKVKKDDEEDRLLKDDLLAKLRAIDEGKPDRSPSSNRKEYNFTEPVNNLHQGLPSHGNRKSNIFGDDSPTFGSYQPSFMLSDTKMTKTKDGRTSSNKIHLENKTKPSDLFGELFVPEPKRASNVLTDARHDSPVLLDLGGSTMKAKPHPTQLHREKQAIVPVFRSTAKKIEFSDEEIEEIEELAIK